MMKNEHIPKVGISLLAYNQGKYIEEAIDALKGQSFQDFEVFLIDDASDDGYTTEILKNIKYEKIRKNIFMRKT